MTLAVAGQKRRSSSTFVSDADRPALGAERVGDGFHWCERVAHEVSIPHRRVGHSPLFAPEPTSVPCAMMTQEETTMDDLSLHYRVDLQPEGGLVRVSFARAGQALRPDEAPDWTETFATRDAAIQAAERTLDDWLRARLKSGDCLLRPGMYVRRTLFWENIKPTLRVVLAAMLRMTQQEHGWTDSEMAAQVRLSPGDLADLLNPDSSPTAEVLAKGRTAAMDTKLWR